jgi:3D (Asp-Asp-Asp) domain-containing protein
MTNRPQQLTTVLKLTGIASLMLFIGATAQPVMMFTPAPAPRISVVRQVVAPIGQTVAAVTPIAATAPDELLHDAVTASATLPSSTDSVAHRLRVIRMEVTAYCPCPKCCGENAQGITASGHDVSYNNSHFVAADTEVLPFGTKLVIPGYTGAPGEVIDRGGAIKGNKLDLYFPTHEEALQWGRKFIDVTVVD